MLSGLASGQRSPDRKKRLPSAPRPWGTGTADYVVLYKPIINCVLTHRTVAALLKIHSPRPCGAYIINCKRVSVCGKCAKSKDSRHELDGHRKTPRSALAAAPKGQLFLSRHRFVYHFNYIVPKNNQTSIANCGLINQQTR